jgi:two-component system, chemotaxis family, protein-glutamate methylesterase/glutaminase
MNVNIGDLSSPAFDVVALASSAGGLQALNSVLADLPGSFPAAILVVQHLDPRHRSLMADLLARRTDLKVLQAQEGDRIKPGTVMIAPPDRHMLASEEHTISLTRSALVHYVRPSADLLFESVAGTYRERAVAVVLTGTGSDGAQGVRAIKSTGGTVIVQDPKTAAFNGMPDSAVRTGVVDFVLPLEEIASGLVRLVCGGES